jgi:hypothetical protein
MLTRLLDILLEFIKTYRVSSTNHQVEGEIQNDMHLAERIKEDVEDDDITDVNDGLTRWVRGNRSSGSDSERRG